MTKTTILMTLIIAMTFIVLATTSPAYAQVSNFFWSEDDGTGEVFTADSAGQNVVQVTTPSNQFVRIDDVEIDPLAGKLWWNNWTPGFFNAGPAEDIYNANLDGSFQTSLGLVNSCPGGGFASGLTGIVLDPANQRLFYTRAVSYANCPSGEVTRVNMDGSAQTALDTGSWHADGIDLSGSTVYWSNPGVLTTGPANGPLNQMDTAGGNKVLSQLPHVTGDGRSLAVDAANALLFYSSHNPFGRGAGGDIFVVDLNNIGAGATNVLNDPNTGIPDVELDAANMRIYWTDYARGEIRSASYDAAGNLGPITTEVGNLKNPYGLALELVINQPPDCTNAAPSEALLWPPNHKFVDISISGVTDPDGDPVTITVTKITQDEELNAKGKGDGNTSPDGSGVGTDTAQVRAERSGTSDGRVYEISFTADDGNGGTCTGSVQVGVPHDQKKPVTALDSGQSVDSTGP